MNSGSDNFVAKSPTLNHQLPVDDKLWDQNVRVQFMAL
jgi:hypothetical protein